MTRGHDSAVVLIAILVFGYVIPAYGQATATPAGECAPTKRPAATPSVIIVNAAADGKIAYTSAQPVVRLPVIVENRSNAALKDVAIALDAFENGTTDAVAADAAAVLDLPGKERRQFVVTGTFYPAGAYVAYGRVRWKTRTLASFRIELTRTLAALPIDVAIPAAQQVTTTALHGPLHITLPIRLYATGSPVLVPFPVLTSATHKTKVDSTAGVDTPVSLASGSEVRVLPGAPGEIAATLTGIHAPGRYDVKLRFVSAGYTSIEKDAAVYVRDPWWVALLLVALGVIISFAVKQSEVMRQWLTAKRGAEEVLAEIRAAAERAHTAKGAALAREVAQHLEQAWADTRQTGGGKIDELNTYRAIARALPAWDRYAEDAESASPAEVREVFDAELEAVRQIFVAAPPDAAKVAEGRAKLSALRAKVDDKISKTLRDQMEAMKSQLPAAGDATTTRIRELLADADASLRRGGTAPAVRSFMKARLLYVHVLAEALRSAANQVPPDGIATWSAIATSALAGADAAEKEKDDPERAMGMVTDTVSAFQKAILNDLQDTTDQLGLGKDVQEIIDKAETARKERRFTEAWRLIARAQHEYSAALTAAGAGAGAKMSSGAGGGGSATVLDASAVFDIFPLFGFPPRDAGLNPDAGVRTKATMLIATVGVSLVVVAIATLIGWEAAWADNPTWGGASAYVLAATWGFSVDQLTHGAIAAIRKK